MNRFTMLFAILLCSGCETSHCPDGFLRDNLGNCLELPDEDGASPESDDDDAAPDSARIFVCNAIQWANGDPLDVEIECSGESIEATTGECGSCTDLEPGDHDCTIYFDGDAMMDFGASFDEGQEHAFVVTLNDAGNDWELLGVDVDCGTDLFE